MKKYLPLLLLLLTFSNCKKDNEPQIITNTDISVSSTENMIVYTSDAELAMLTDAILTFNYNGVPTDEIITYVTIESDSTELRASIDFKDEHRDKYIDPNPNNNFVVIDLEKSQATIIDDELGDAINADQFCEMYEILRDELPLFNLSTQNFVCIPLTFLIPNSLNIEQTDLNNAVNDLNDNFLDAKISFEISQVKQIPDNPYYNLQIDDVQNYVYDVPNTLNVYIANSLKHGQFNLNGRAHFPTDYIDRVYAKGSFFDESRDKYSALLSHEIGHFLSLYHTFETAVPSCLTGSGCLHTGDAVCDTPQDNCCALSTTVAYGLICNPSNSDKRLLVQNFMSYALNVWTLRNCQRRFTPDQLNRAAFAARFWKSHLTCQGSTGSSNIQLSGDLNFGNVQINTSSNSKILTISNTGSESFNITNMTSTNSAFTIVNPQSAQLQPNTSIDIYIQFNPTSLQNYTGTISITNNADNASNNSTIQVTGTGVDNSGTSIIALSGNLSFGNVNVGQSESRTFTIQNTGSEVFSVSNIIYPYPVYSSTWTSGTVQAGNSKSVTVVFQPNSQGNYNGSVTVINNSDTGSNTIQISGAGIDNSGSSIISVSGNLNFGSVEVGQSETRNFTISNTGNENFYVSDIDFPSNAYTANWNSGTVSPGNPRNVTVTFEPTSAQNYNGVVTVYNNADTGGNTININGSGQINTSSIISVSGNLNFGSVEVGQSETRNFTISNTGNENFYVSDIDFPSNAYTTNWNSGTVSPGNPRNVTVTFEPTSAQNYNGVVTVYNNADTGGNTINISGSGQINTSSIISVSGNLNFGSVEVGQSETRNFTISNTGNENFYVSGINFPSSAYSASWNSGTVSPGNPRNVTVTFQPTFEQSYNGTVYVNSDADSGSNTISINGSGVSTGQPNLIYESYDIDSDDNNNGIVEAGEDIDLDIEIRNIGNATATNIEVFISTNDSDIDITDPDRTYDDMPMGDSEWNSGSFDFNVSSNCPTKTVTFYMTISSDEGSWNDSFTINVQGQSGGNNPISITPSNNCSSAPFMQIGTEYEVNIDIGDYGASAPIDGQSYGGGNVRGFWLRYQEPLNYVGELDIRIYDVSNNFDPVIGRKYSCSGIYYTQWNENDFVANDGSYGDSETFDDYSAGFGYNGYIRIYHYYGDETPNISFKIIVE